MVEIYRELLTLLEADEVGALCTVIHSAGSSPQKIGSKMLVRSDGSIAGTIGGGAVEQAAIEEAKEVIGKGTATRFEAHLSRDLAMCCGGRMEIFIEPVGNRPWLLLFGGGHVGTATCEVAAQAGFRVHVIDERPEFAASERHPRADATTCSPPLDCLDDLPWGLETYVVIVTHSHRSDEDLLARLVGQDCRYLGMIGSQAKVLRFLDRYNHRGMDPNRFVGVHAPIGLDVGAREPGEIAVAIVAEMIAIRRGRSQEAHSSLTIAARGAKRSLLSKDNT